MRILQGHTGPVRCLAYAPDGLILASGSDDGTVRLWDLATGHLYHTLAGPQDWVRSVAFAPDGRRLAAGCWDDQLYLRHLPSRNGFSKQPRLVNGVAGASGGFWAVAFSPDGWSLAGGGGDGSVVVLRRRESKEIRHTLSGHRGPVTTVAYSPDGQWLATGSHDRTIKLRDGNWLRERASLVGHEDWVRIAAFAPDGQTLASGDYEGTILLWDVPRTKDIVGPAPHSPLEIHPRSVLRGHQGPVCQVAFTAGGRTLASASWDGTVRFRDVAGGRERRAFDWQIGKVHCLAFSPDGLTAAAGGQDHSILVWDLDDAGG